MDLIRCLVADVPQRMLGDIVKRVVEQEGSVEIVGSVNTVDDISLFVEKQSIDLLIVGIDSENVQFFYDGLVSILSDVMVFGLIDDGRGSLVYINDIGVEEMLGLINMYAKKIN